MNSTFYFYLCIKLFMMDIKDVSYCVGMSLGMSLREQQLTELSIDDVAAAMKDVFEGNDFKFSDEQANSILQEYVRSQSEKKFAVNKEAGENFLVENNKRDEVTETASGLQFEILTEGSGEKPSAQSTVTVHYHGTLIDGTVFDSSVNRGEPATFGVNQVIKGWTEALQLMSEGSKYRLYIPQELGYGANPHPGGAIEPYMALIFDVELLKVS